VGARCVGSTPSMPLWCACALTICGSEVEIGRNGGTHSETEIGRNDSRETEIMMASIPCFVPHGIAC
jgi:hypothetical protein